MDAAEHDQVVAAFQGVDWVVICMPLTGLGAAMARAALEAGVHYIDINGNCFAPSREIRSGLSAR